MATYKLNHTTRPLSRVHVGVAPGMDARWRGVRMTTTNVDTLRRIEMQRKRRDKKMGRLQ